MHPVRKILDRIRTILGAMVVLGCVAFAGAAVVTWLSRGRPPLERPRITRLLPAAPGRLIQLGVTRLACLGPKEFSPAAADNRATLNTTALTPFGVPENGWAIYAPLIAHEIGTPCGPESAGFAAAFAHWQSAHSLSGAGRVDAPALSLLATTWLLRRPFVRAMKAGCPASPDEQTLEKAEPAESFGGKAILARPAALQAYRRMVLAARADIGGSPDLLKIASGYRGPTEEAARCADGGCGNPARAHCSAHRTGLAFDLYLGSAPGREPFSTANEDRLFQSRTALYGWLVSHAEQFGFVPYPYEPWHWEWTGEGV